MGQKWGVRRLFLRKPGQPAPSLRAAREQHEETVIKGERPMASEIVPFGKYKGQPIEALAQDKSYLEWLSAQDWFRERYANIYTLVLNNFAEPSESTRLNRSKALASMSNSSLARKPTSCSPK